jgi:hypothetical protein
MPILSHKRPAFSIAEKWTPAGLFKPGGFEYNTALTEVPC